MNIANLFYGLWTTALIINRLTVHVFSLFLYMISFSPDKIMNVYTKKILYHIIIFTGFILIIL